ncbi:MAG TPA: hypothetical protein VFV50_09620 [Bdellovibrionales bacterium]|nr:hypothetical protein [Bdellovibrionales bacterium]
MRFISVTLVSSALIAAAPAARATDAAAQPAYCTLEGLKATEKTEEAGRLKRMRVFQLGQVIVAGLGVGDSEAVSVKKLASKYSNASAAQKYCTWYVNDGNDGAKRAFNWRYVSKPMDSDDVGEYLAKLGPVFAENAVNMMKCAEQQRFIAMGCNGMKHRGPTLFGMLLAYSGCDPKAATRAVNSIWGLNGVDAGVRAAIIKKAYELGEKNPEARERLQAQLAPN